MSNAMTQFEALRARMDTFLARLEQRADEALAEAVPVAREMAAGGKDAVNSPEYLEFVGGMTSQVTALGTRARQTFAEHFAIFDDHDDDDVSEAYEALEYRVECWAEDIADKAQSAFAEVTVASGGSAYQQAWDDAVAEWRNQANSFRCPQCSAPVPLPEFELCEHSQYVACTGCGTQTTFMPNDTIVYGVQIAHQLVEERTAAFEKVFDRLNDDPDGDMAQTVVACAQWKAAEQVVWESLTPRAAATKLDTVRLALEDLAEFYAPDAHGYGYLQVETSYYRALMGLANTIAHYRGQGREREAELICQMLPVFGRSGCEVTAAIIAGTYTEALGRSYLDRAQTCEVAYNLDGTLWKF